MKGHFSCSNIIDFSPSAVQSATIQPQSRVLKGKPPWKGFRRAQHFPLTCSVLVREKVLPLIPVPSVQIPAPFVPPSETTSGHCTLFIWR